MLSDEKQTHIYHNNIHNYDLTYIIRIWGLSLRKHTYFVAVALMILGLVLCPIFFWNWWGFFYFQSTMKLNQRGLEV